MMSRDRRAAKKRSARRRALNLDGYTPIGVVGPEDVPRGAFQPPPPPNGSPEPLDSKQAG